MNSSDPMAWSASEMDVSACDQEPIHLVNAIQPHAALLVLDESGLLIRQASANTQAFLGLPADALIGQALSLVLGPANTADLLPRLASLNLTGILAHVACLEQLPHVEGSLHVFGNRIDGLLLLEFERADHHDFRQSLDSLLGLRDATQRLQRTEALNTFLELAVEQIRGFSGFDRVMAYRFAEDGSGEVVAESMVPGLESYLGLHYPASDIPAPARRLFALLPLRHLPDVAYAPVTLWPEQPSGGGGGPVDLSYCFSRSVSLMYSLYLRNMGVKATLVMPLLRNGELWGLISCMHHGAPYYLSYERRIPLEVLAQLVSQLLGSRVELDQLQYRSRLDRTLGRLIHAMGQSDSLVPALMEGGTNLLSDIDAGGVALLTGDGVHLMGRTPGQDQVLALADWLAGNPEEIHATHDLPAVYPPAGAYREHASGILTLSLSRRAPDRIIWFRPEVLTEVSWAGDPRKPVEIVEQNGDQRLMPRASFALWKETVQGQSRPWLECERDYAICLRRAILDMMVERIARLAQVNVELERRNLELDSFAYAASHDMKEPLRGIYNMIEFLIMEEQEQVSDKGRERMNKVLQLAQRMTGLLDALLQYSRVGRNPLNLSDASLDSVAREAIDVIRHAHPEQVLEFEVQAGLPVIRCDKVWVGAVFQNLISNAAKYNDRPVKRVEIGCDLRQDPPVFFVRDNGIGISPEHHGRLFELFRRLHGGDDYGGGAGAGLAIVKKAVERHGGRIWIDSRPGQGAIFYFTLAPAPDH
ncbi:MAG: ATP-binding protein [Methylococcus sp.]